MPRFQLGFVMFRSRLRSLTVWADYDYDHSDFKVHVANGLRALYEAFGPESS